MSHVLQTPDRLKTVEDCFFETLFRRDVKEHNFLKEEAKTLAMMSPEERLQYGESFAALHSSLDKNGDP